MEPVHGLRQSQWYREDKKKNSNNERWNEACLGEGKKRKRKRKRRRRGVSGRKESRSAVGTSHGHWLCLILVQWGEDDETASIISGTFAGEKEEKRRGL